MQQKSYPPFDWEEIDIDTFPHDFPTVIAQLRQSLDGQIVTASGQIKSFHDAASLTHRDRLRDWADVLLVDIDAVMADALTPGVRDKPELGAPCVVVVSSRTCAQVPPWLLALDATRKVILTTSVVLPTGWPDDIEVVELDDVQDPFSPGLVVQWLAQQGFRKVLIEEDATTTVRFLQADCLNYLHLMISPQLIGHGQPSLAVHPVSQLSQTQRFKIRAHALGEDQLVVCDFKASPR